MFLSSSFTPQGHSKDAPRWFSTNPSKRWGEIFFLAYSPVWILIFGGVVATEMYKVRCDRRGEGEKGLGTRGESRRESRGGKVEDGENGERMERGWREDGERMERGWREDGERRERGRREEIFVLKLAHRNLGMSNLWP